MERPILFSTAMVQAILAGRKTQTRRTKGLEKISLLATEVVRSDNWAKQGDWIARFKFKGEERYEATDIIKCPYGKPGDKEWQTGMPPTDGYYYVKNEFDGKPVFLRPCRKPEFDEEFITWGWTENDDPEDISFDGGPAIETIQWKRQGDVLWVRESYSKDYFDFNGGNHAYKADWNKTNAEYVSEPKWKPSIHMPKAAARIWLRITNVRVERLHDINYADRFDDAVAEGVSRRDDGYWMDYTSNDIKQCTPQDSFASLWKAINGEQSWNDNPWVWVVEFETIEKPSGV